MKFTYDYNSEQVVAVKQSMAYDGKDFAAWQVSAREKLKELLGLQYFTKVDPCMEIEYEKDIPGAKEIRFTFATEEGYRVPCHLFLPEGVKNPPLMIALQGHSTGMHISMGRALFEKDVASISGGDRDFCVRALKEGFATIAMEQRCFGELGGKYFGGTGCQQPSMTELMMGRTTIGGRVWDLMRLVDLLEAEFSHLVDIKCICCMGNSGGGTATAYFSALEDRIVLAMPSSAMATLKDSIGTKKHCTCNYVPRMVNYFDMGDLLAMSWPKYFVQVNGVLDPSFPIDSARVVFAQGQRAYADMGGADRCTLIEGQEGHRFYADLSWPVVHKYLGR